MADDLSSIISSIDEESSNAKAKADLINARIFELQNWLDTLAVRTRITVSDDDPIACTHLQTTRAPTGLRLEVAVTSEVKPPAEKADDWVPLTSASVSRRIEAIELLPKLMERIHKQQVARAEQLESGLRKLRNLKLPKGNERGA